MHESMLQVHKLLSRGGHFFMVTVPENDPQGEKLHVLLQQCSRFLARDCKQSRQHGLAAVLSAENKVVLC